MSLVHLARIAVSMPPRIAARKILAFGAKRLRHRFAALKARGRCSYVAPFPGLRPRLTDAIARPMPPERLRHWLAHRFDLLGSGWVRVAHGESYAGFGPHRYGPGPALPADWRSAIARRHWSGNRARAADILALIDDPAWCPIDWQVDFRSGYRWSERVWGGSVSFGHRPGVDVKLPWELARLQHLPAMALADAAWPDPALARAFRNQVLDFLGANPPGWGVNWACAMDVAIRVANMLVAWDLFRAAGRVFDRGFESELAAAVLAHGRHIRANLEWNEHHRGNHYLADLCGLAFCGAYLTSSPETEDWLRFARAEIEAEIVRQFQSDGSNFEASTAYHRLSAEMALYTVALLGGVGAAAMTRLSRVAGFARAVTKPAGEIVQVGDNDSGRFLALEGEPNPLDPSGMIRAAAGLFDLDPSPPAGAETELVAAFAGGGRHRVACPSAPTIAARPVDPEPGRVVVIVPPDPAALDGMEPIAFADFGLFLWRNARSFVSVRCGPIGQNGNGGHAHNDQLAVEIEIDGVAWVRDPGTFVYTPDLEARNRYRSALAHFVPRRGQVEPARMIAPFRLEDRAKAEVLRFGPDFVGRHVGFGAAVHRRVALQSGTVVIEDWPAEPARHVVDTPAALARLWGLDLAFSPGYGLREEGR